jgi:pimeloyl-ACP methyl ester carboxylesterase
MKARVAALELEYETFGDRRSPAMLLVMGLGSQMVHWDENFCRQLAERGFFVIRFDNRDVGLSSKLESAGRPNVPQAYMDAGMGRPVDAPYRLWDMADDAFGLLDALDIGRAHVVGVSMGGMIAQEMAVRNPDRVLSLASLLSTTGERELPGATPEAQAILLERPPVDRATYVDRALRVYRVIGSPGFPRDEARIQRIAELAFDRCFYPVGFARQLVCVLASGGRKKKLAGVRCPTLVLHGGADPLVPIACGKDTADSISGAEFVVIEGMGHELPPGAWARIIDALERNARRAESSATQEVAQ